ncbi:hypothetical protein [Halobacterium yunchengense]|uniref:hypothetical protein n=1 Tax=Halobacterium yunchengense TaxID=3108497 RepID=UPI0030088E42
MPEDATADVATWMLVLSGVVVAFLVGVGLLQLSLTGDVGSFARDLGIAVVLVAFGAGFYRKWHDA